MSVCKSQKGRQVWGKSTSFLCGGPLTLLSSQGHVRGPPGTVRMSRPLSLHLPSPAAVSPHPRPELGCCRPFSSLLQCSPTTSQQRHWSCPLQLLYGRCRVLLQGTMRLQGPTLCGSLTLGDLRGEGRAPSHWRQPSGAPALCTAASDAGSTLPLCLARLLPFVLATKSYRACSPGWPLGACTLPSSRMQGRATEGFRAVSVDLR